MKPLMFIKLLNSCNKHGRFRVGPQFLAVISMKDLQLDLTLSRLGTAGFRSLRLLLPDYLDGCIYCLQSIVTLTLWKFLFKSIEHKFGIPF